MYIYYVTITKEAKQVQSLKNIKNTNKVTVVNKQPSKLCIDSQVNQTKDRGGCCLLVNMHYGNFFANKIVHFKQVVP